MLLLLPTETYRAPDFLEAARVLGADVVVGSNRSFAIAPAMQERPVLVDFEVPEAGAEAIAAYAEQAPLDAVVATDDQGVLVATLAAERLGLPQNPVGAAEATRDKAALRRALEAGAIPQPRYRQAGAGADVAALAEEVGCPVVVKPVPLSASRGVIRANDAESAVLAAKRARSICEEADAGSGAPLLIESYVPGKEVAVEGMLRGGDLEILAPFDKPDPLEGPYCEETMYVTPSRLADATQGAIKEVTDRAIATIGLTEGPVHAELRVDDGDVWMLEIAARPIGGLCSRSLRFGFGATLEKLILRHALRLPLRERGREWAASGVMMIPITAPGVLRRVGGQGGARRPRDRRARYHDRPGASGQAAPGGRPFISGSCSRRAKTPRGSRAPCPPLTVYSR
ncbi:MAG: ATP-grasp domain-containing protein [Actinobacteria bacterium]|nr:ATP-grasp domain-containing protein [Actinomycetota bacterium]